MLLQKFKALLSTPLQLIPIIVFCLVMAAALNIYVMKNKYDEVKDYSQNMEDTYVDKTWEEVEEVINTSYYSSKLNSKIIALRLENSIRMNYDDLNDLKVQFEEDSFTTEFHELLKDNLLKDDIQNKLKSEPYLTLLGTESHLISSFANDKYNSFRGLKDEPIVDWETFLNTLPNPELGITALEMVMNQSNDVIFTQSKVDSVGGTITTVDMSTLKNIYLTEGMEGLENFSLLAPSYITEEGDIFGNNDSTFMQKNKTHKIIVIQVVNLSDILDAHEKLFKQLDLNHDQQLKAIESFLIREVSLTAAWSVICFIISLILIGVHNAEVRRHECCQRDDEEER